MSQLLDLLDADEEKFGGQYQSDNESQKAGGLREMLASGGAGGGSQVSCRSCLSMDLVVDELGDVICSECGAFQEHMGNVVSQRVASGFGGEADADAGEALSVPRQRSQQQQMTPMVSRSQQAAGLLAPPGSAASQGLGFSAGQMSEQRRLRRVRKALTAEAAAAEQRNVVESCAALDQLVFEEYCMLLHRQLFKMVSTLVKNLDWPASLLATSHSLWLAYLNDYRSLVPWLPGKETQAGLEFVLDVRNVVLSPAAAAAVLGPQLDRPTGHAGSLLVRRAGGPHDEVRAVRSNRRSKSRHEAAALKAETTDGVLAHLLLRLPVPEITLTIVYCASALLALPVLPRDLVTMARDGVVPWAKWRQGDLLAALAAVECGPEAAKLFVSLHSSLLQLPALPWPHRFRQLPARLFAALSLVHPPLSARLLVARHCHRLLLPATVSQYAADRLMIALEPMPLFARHQSTPEACIAAIICLSILFLHPW